MNKKEKQKIADTLMAFYQSACGLYEGLANIEDEEVHDAVFKEHMFQLLLYHKAFTDEHKILIPEITELYTKYCKNFTRKLMSMEHLLKNIVMKIKKKEEDIGYIS